MKSSLDNNLSSQISTNPLFFQYFSLARKITHRAIHPLKLPPFFEFSLIFIQIFQLFSELLLQTNDLDSTLDFDSKAYVQPILLLAQIISPGWLLDFEIRTELSLAIVGLMIAICMVKLGLIIYGVAYATEKIPHQKTLVLLVNWELKTLVPVTFFMTLSIFSRIAFLAWKDKINVAGMNNVGCIVGFVFLGIVRSGVVIGLVIFQTYLLPNSSLLAVNSKSADLTIVFHQIVLLCLQFLSENNVERNMWIVMLTSLFFCLVSLYLHFTRFVSQNVKSLYFKGYLLALLTLLNVVLVIRVMVISANPENKFGVDTVLIVFGVLSPVLVKLVRAYLDGELLRIFTDCKDNSLSLYKRMYKISILNHAFKARGVISKNQRPNDYECLIYTITERIFADKPGIFKGENIDSKYQKNQIIARYLEVLSVKFPKSDLVKLYTAYYHGRKLKNYEQAIKILAKIENTSDQNIGISACLLKRDIETEMKRKNEVSNSRQVDLKKYLESKISFLRFQGDMLKQIDLQIEIYKEYIKQRTNMSKIYEISQKVVRGRKILGKSLPVILTKMPDEYLEPYYFLQGYYLTAQHSLRDYNKYSKIINQKLQKAHKNSENIHINPDNLYDPCNVFMVISAQKENIGQIHYCSKSAFEMLGWDPRSLNGKNISTILPTFLHKFSVDLISSFSEESTKIITDHVFQGFMRHRGGYLVQVDFCLAVHPLMHQGFFLDVLLKPIPENKKDFMVLLEDGQIGGFTRSVGNKLGLLYLRQKNNVEIQQISKRLAQVNEAFNIANRDAAENKEIIEMFLNSGEGIMLKAVNYESPRSSSSPSRRNLPTNLYGYHCKIEEWGITPQMPLRVCVLEEDRTKKEEAQNYSPQTEFNLQKLTFPFPQQEDSENFEMMSEKLEGDPEIEQDYFSKPTFEAQRTTTNDRLLTLSHRGLLDSPSPTNVKSTIIDSDFLQNQKKRIRSLPVIERATSVHSRNSQDSYYGRNFNAYQAAVKTSYYRKSVIYVIRLTMAIFAAILALQIMCQVEMDSSLTETREKKNIIEAAQERNYFLLQLQGYAKWEVQYTTFLKYYNIVVDPKTHIILDLGSFTLSESNGKLMQATSSLQNNADRDRLFQKNVRIYDWDNDTSYMNMTNFQAADTIAQTITGSINQIYANKLAQAIASFTFIVKNCLNDLLITSEETVTIFINSLKIFRNDTETFLSCKYYICLGLLCMILIIGALLLRSEYMRLRGNIMAFSSLEMESVKELLENLVEFRQSVENETTLEGEQSEYLYHKQHMLILDPTRSHTKKPFREFEDQDLTRKYIMHGVKLVVISGLLVGLFSGYRILLEHRITDVHKKVAQVYYSSWILSQTYLCYVSLAELFSQEKMTVIRNQPAYDQAIESMEEVQGVIHQIAQGYFSTDGTNYDDEVYRLLFQNVCEETEKDSYMEYFCTLPQNIGKSINFLNIISTIEYNTNLVLREYKNSTKTITVLNQLIGQINADIIPSMSAQEIINNDLTARVSVLFEESVKSSISRNVLLGAWTDIIIVLTAGVAWLLVFRRISQVDNEFKNMLSIFPFSLILMNYRLKKYFQETSKETFATIVTKR